MWTVEKPWEKLLLKPISSASHLPSDAIILLSASLNAPSAPSGFQCHLLITHESSSNVPANRSRSKPSVLLKTCSWFYELPIFTYAMVYEYSLYTSNYPIYNALCSTDTCVSTYTANVYKLFAFWREKSHSMEWSILWDTNIENMEQMCKLLLMLLNNNLNSTHYIHLSPSVAMHSSSERYDISSAPGQAGQTRIVRH